MTLTPETITNKQAALQALQWYVDNGVDEMLGDAPLDYFAQTTPAAAPLLPSSAVSAKQATNTKSVAAASAVPEMGAAASSSVMGVEAQKEALSIANAADSLESLKTAIEKFDGLEVKKTAGHFVFADGNPSADIMVIIDIPGDQDDRQGKPLAGGDGALFDRALACIAKSRSGDAPENSLYIAPLINWRTPGSRSLTSGELATTLPLLERHIALVKPKLLMVCGAVASKALLGKREGISRLRKKDHTYQTQSALSDKISGIPCVTTYTPSYILEAPSQKRAFWSDLLKIKEILRKMGEESA